MNSMFYTLSMYHKYNKYINYIFSQSLNYVYISLTKFEDFFIIILLWEQRNLICIQFIKNYTSYNYGYDFKTKHKKRTETLTVKLTHLVTHS